nr:PREDICTED: uncharacterized protein LOC106706182 [Latimeria chalumnae]|eukprot:XP_014352216.1 PREDICTED: uncharacterized protein LOC106706182 [Latimeria chalumnae]
MVVQSGIVVCFERDCLCGPCMECMAVSSFLLHHPVPYGVCQNKDCVPCNLWQCPFVKCLCATPWSPHASACWCCPPLHVCPLSRHVLTDSGVFHSPHLHLGDVTADDVLQWRQFWGQAPSSGGLGHLGDPPHLLLDGHPQVSPFVFNFSHLMTAMSQSIHIIGDALPLSFLVRQIGCTSADEDPGCTFHTGHYLFYLLWKEALLAEAGHLDPCSVLCTLFFRLLLLLLSYMHIYILWYCNKNKLIGCKPSPPIFLCNNTSCPYSIENYHECMQCNTNEKLSNSSLFSLYAFWTLRPTVLSPEPYYFFWGGG